jgi:tripartite motif-containing protein 71
MFRRTFVTLALFSPVAASLAPFRVVAAQADATPESALAPVALEFLWASAGGPEPFTNPYGIGIAPDGNIWVSDGFNGRFQILAPDGTFVETRGKPGAGNGEFDFETVFGGAAIGYGDVAWDEAGNIYVVDTGNRRVQKFGPDRAFLLAWGGEGDGDGQFLKPNSIAVNAQGIVYVSDEGRVDVQRFDGEGRFLGTIGERGSGDGQFIMPAAVTIDDAGDVWVTDWSRHRVQRFRPDGELLDAWGTGGSKEGELIGPNDIALDDDGRVYIWDDRNFRISIFTRDGKFLFATKGYGLEPGQFLSGAGLAFGDGVLYVSDMGRHDVQAFRVVVNGD